MEQPPGGPPRFFALASTASGAVLCGTCGRGTSRSPDGGRTWAPQPGIPGSGWVNAFAAGDACLFAATAGTGLHRSDDDGATWRPTRLDDGTLFSALAAGDVLLAGTEGLGVLRSLDAGSRWDPIDELRGTTVYRLVMLATGGVLAATAGAGMWLADYADGPWRPAGLNGLTVYAVAELPGGRLLAGTREAGAHRSDDRGASWAPSGTGLADPVVHALLVDDEIVLAGTARGVAASHDGGETWHRVGDVLAERRIFSLAHTATGRRFAGSYDGVWTADADSYDWTPVDTGLCDDAFSVYADGSGSLLAGTGAGDIRRSDDGGATWQPAGDDVGTVYVFLRLSSRRLLAGVDDGVLSADAGTWRWRPAGLAGTRGFCLLEVEPGVVLAGTLGSGLHRWSDAAGRWAPVAGVPHPMALDLLRTRAGDVLVATGDVVGGAKTGGIHRSVDGGRSWSPATTPATTVYRLVEMSTGVLLAGAQRSQILRSTDGGSGWAPVETTGLVGAKLYAMAIDADDLLYLGAGAGLRRSDDGGTTWVALDSPALDGVTVFDLAADPGGALVAATSAGILRSTDRAATWHGAAHSAAVPARR